MISYEFEPASSRLIVVLNGASSSGKSEICKAVVRQEPAIRHVSADDFLARHGYAGQRLIEVVHEEGERFIREFHHAVKTESQQAAVTIVDHVAGEKAEWVSDLESQCCSTPLLWVKVVCSETELCERESRRDDRVADIHHALRQAHTIHQFIPHYGIELDSTSASPDELARDLLTQLAPLRLHV